MALESAAVQELVYSLAWAPWSANHSENACRLLVAALGDETGGRAFVEYIQIATAAPGRGSPK